MSRAYHADLRIGTLIKGDGDPARMIRQIGGHGFESFQITYWREVPDVSLHDVAQKVKDALAESGQGAVISCLGIYGNPLTDPATESGWSRLIEAAHLFGCNLVCGFAGRIVNRPIPDSLPLFVEVFSPLVRQAADHGVRLAFENCDMGGTWEYGDFNMAHAPRAWEMMFDAIPSDVIGLEWEPCHQMVSLIDPIPQLKQYVSKIFHVHGKDATVHWDVIKKQGIRGGVPFVDHRTPGFGDTNWSDVITELRRGGFRGSIDIEGWHDPVYRDELEMTGQVRALHYLKQCRGGNYVANPE